MRAAVVLVLALVAFGAFIDVEAKRLHKMRAVLRAEEEVEADVVADVEADVAASLPFDDDYWTAGGRSDMSKVVASAAKGKPMSTADILKKFFSDDNILLAQQQGANVVADIGTYKSASMTRSCNQGVCDDNWTKLDIALPTGSQTRGGEGTVRLTCTVPKDLATAKCDVTYWYASNILVLCQNIGGAKSCGVPSYQYVNSVGTWYTRNFVTDTVDGADFYFNGDSFTQNWKWHGTASGKLVFTALVVYTTPFSTYKQTVNPPQPGALAQLTTAAKKTQLAIGDILNKFFTPDNILFAQQQGSPVVTELGAYSSAAITRSCNTGVCSTWDKLNIALPTGSQTRGGEGTVRLSCTVPKDLTTAKCDATYWYASNILVLCQSLGTPKASCGVPSYQYVNSVGTWYTRNFVTDVTEAYNMYFTADQMVMNWKWRGVASGKLVGTDLTVWTTAPFGGYKPYVAPAAPAPLSDLVTASKAKVLTTADLLAKFFTKDNIALAQMQGTGIPVKATIGAYKAVANTRECNNGQCGAYAALDLVAATGVQTRGGEGSVLLTCSVPKDLAQAKCDIGVWYGSSIFFLCPDIGGATKSCGVPSYQYVNSVGTWYTRNFVTDVNEAFGAYFTSEQLVVNWKWRGMSSGKLVNTDLTFYTTTPFADFSTPLKTNCLSKTTTAAVMAAAAEKKNLKNKISLTTTAVDALIKSAPYQTVQQAIDKIKGIGPVNVVYVSFMWNFQC